MHILYLHQYFSTPNGRATTAAFDFARRWVGAGHRVTVVTSTARLVDEDVGGPVDRRRVHRFRTDGIDVVAWRVRYRQSMSFTRRMASFTLFSMLATWFAVRARNVDVILTSSSPLTIGLAGIVALRLRRRPFVFEVRDVWPEVPIQMGVLRSPVLIALARWLERRIYRDASAVIAVSPGMAELVRRVAPANTPVRMVPNNSDSDSFRPDVDGSAVRASRGWEGRIVCVHTGAMGKVNGLEVVIRAADRLRARPDLLFALIGEGSEKAWLVEEVRRRGLTNVQISGGVPKRDMPATLAAADLCLMTVTPVPILEHNSANKFFDYLCAGRPVLLNYGGWQRDALEGAGAGFGCPMGDDEAFFARLVEMTSDSERRRTMGVNARQLALERFQCDRLAAEALAVIETAAQRPRSGDGGSTRRRHVSAPDA